MLKMMAALFFRGTVVLVVVKSFFCLSSALSSECSVFFFISSFSLRDVLSVP